MQGKTAQGEGDTTTVEKRKEKNEIKYLCIVRTL